MNKELLLSPEIQEFIKVHELDDPITLLLQRNKYPDLPLVDIAEQIKSRGKAKNKLPVWYSASGVLFPRSISIEQSSSQITAEWKSKFIGDGDSGVDLTGGFGVDSFYFAKNFKSWCHVEPNSELQSIVSNNAASLSQTNTRFINQKAEDFLEGNTKSYDLIYIDPDRRPSENRVYGLADSLPNIIGLLPSLKKVAARVLIKASPMIDISACLKEIKVDAEVITLAVNNELKEVLFLVDFQPASNPHIRCVNLDKGNEIVVNFNLKDRFQEVNNFGLISTYLYEPNVTVLKAGVQNALSNQYGHVKLNRNTNLFSSELLIKDYPGRVFKVIAIEPYQKKAILPHLNNKQANLSTRNFVDTPLEMKKKLGTIDGGDIYLFGYRDLENRNKVAICRKAY